MYWKKNQKWSDSNFSSWKLQTRHTSRALPLRCIKTIQWEHIRVDDTFCNTPHTLFCLVTFHCVISSVPHAYVIFTLFCLHVSIALICVLFPANIRNNLSATYGITFRRRSAAHPETSKRKYFPVNFCFFHILRRSIDSFRALLHLNDMDGLHCLVVIMQRLCRVGQSGSWPTPGFF